MSSYFGYSSQTLSYEELREIADWHHAHIGAHERFYPRRRQAFLNQLDRIRSSPEFIADEPNRVKFQEASRKACHAKGLESRWDGKKAS